MFCRALFASLTLSLASLPAASLADDIKPKTAESAFAARMRPDILVSPRQNPRWPSFNRLSRGASLQ
jgi:hypothetical protein